MTAAFDNESIARLDAPLFSLECEFPDGSECPHTMKVEQVSVRFARSYIAKYHYTQSMPDSTLFCFAGWYGQKLAGVAVFGMGGSKARYTSVIADIKNGEYAELTRLWCPDAAPRNTESRLIAASIKMLPLRIKLLLSYADDGMGHKGTIYRATNWLYVGATNASDVLVDGNGKVFHPRLLGIYRMRRPEFAELSDSEIMRKIGLHRKAGSFKHKYIYLRFGRVKNRFARRRILAEWDLVEQVA